jgi:hypothetical protein
MYPIENKDGPSKGAFYALLMTTLHYTTPDVKIIMRDFNTHCLSNCLTHSSRHKNRSTTELLQVGRLVFKLKAGYCLNNSAEFTFHTP